MTNDSPLISRARILIGFIAGGGMLLIVSWMLVNCLNVWRYASLDGKVLAARIENTKSPKVNLYRPVITYTYVVAGVRYENQTVTPVDDDGSESWAKSIVELYPIGEKCTVYYDPLFPQYSVLMRVPQWTMIWLIILASLWGFLSFTAAYWMVRAYYGYRSIVNK